MQLLLHHWDACEQFTPLAVNAGQVGPQHHSVHFLQPQQLVALGYHRALQAGLSFSFLGKLLRQRMAGINMLYDDTIDCYS